MMPRIAAVMVSYNPPEGVSGRVRLIMDEVEELVIVDNGSDAKVRGILEAIQATYPQRIVMMWNDQNRGLAAALNQGIQRAIAGGAEWVLLLDHDSEPVPGMVERMLAGYRTYPDPDTVGLLAPDIYDQNTNVHTRYLTMRGVFLFRRIVSCTSLCDHVLCVITSGSLVKASVFAEIGPMPEHFFIDYIDYAFCLAMRKQGYRILLVRDAALKHKLGSKTEHRMAGLTVVASHHSALRRYTIFRNRIWLWRRYGAIFPGFVLHDVLAAGFDIARIIVFEKDKCEKIKAAGKGVAAGMKGEYTPLSSRVVEQG